MNDVGGPIRRAAALVIAGAAALWSTSAQLSTGVSVSYTLVTTNATLGEPILVQFSAENKLAEGVVMYDRVNYDGYGGFQVQVERPDGRTERAPKPTPQVMVGGAPILVEPSKTHSSLLLVNKWVVFDVAGRYTLHLRMTQPPLTRSGTKLPLDMAEGSVVIDVGPRDPARLQRICAELAAKVVNASASTPYWDESEALSYVRDPAAVPYLALILRARVHPIIRRHMIRGLEGIADGPSVDVMIASVPSTPDEEIRSSIRGALVRIEATTTNNAIREKIRASRQ